MTLKHTHKSGRNLLYITIGICKQPTSSPPFPCCFQQQWQPKYCPSIYTLCIIMVARATSCYDFGICGFSFLMFWCNLPLHAYLTLVSPKYSKTSPNLLPGTWPLSSVSLCPASASQVPKPQNVPTRKNYMLLQPRRNTLGTPTDEWGHCPHDLPRTPDSILIPV